MLSLEGLHLGVAGQPMVLKWNLLLLKTSQGFETPWAGMVGEIHAEESNVLQLKLCHGCSGGRVTSNPLKLLSRPYATRQHIGRARS